MNEVKPEDEFTAPTARRLRVSDLLQRPFDIRSIALTGLFILALFYTIYFMRSVLLPLVLALLLSYLLAPVVRALGRLRIFAPIAAAVVLLTLVGGIGVGISFLATPAAGWLQKAPYSLQQLQRKLLPLRRPMERVAQASGEIEKMANSADVQTNTAVEVRHHTLTDTLYLHAPEWVMNTVLLLILLYFLLAYDGVFLMKVIKLTPRLADKKRAVSIAHEIEAHVSRYLPSRLSTCVSASQWERPSVSSACPTRSCGACSWRRSTLCRILARLRALSA